MIHTATDTYLSSGKVKQTGGIFVTNTGTPYICPPSISRPKGYAKVIYVRVLTFCYAILPTGPILLLNPYQIPHSV
jgi:hypothetical protein